MDERGNLSTPQGARISPTPGQIAYTVWWLTRYGMQQADAASAYQLLPPQDRRAWDAAAQAVLAQGPQQAPRIPTLDQVQRRLCRWCGQPIAAHPQEGEAWRCRLSDGPLLPKEDTPHA
jgi:hypothetical protein